MILKKLLPLILCTAAGHASAATLIDFESYALGSNLPANGWILSGADGSAVTVVATANSGAYVGGRAIQTDESGATFAGFFVTQPGISGLQVDMSWAYTGAISPFGTPTIQLSGWDDNGSDGIFATAEREVGLAMDNDETDFEFMSGGIEVDGNISTTFSYDTWYRLTLTWSDADGLGNRDVQLNVYDLTNDVSLGLVNEVTMTSAQFGVDPSEWDGIGIRMSRGTMDNITLIPEPNTTMLGLIASGLVLLRRQRK